MSEALLHPGSSRLTPPPPTRLACLILILLRPRVAYTSISQMSINAQWPTHGEKGPPRPTLHRAQGAGLQTTQMPSACATPALSHQVRAQDGAGQLTHGGLPFAKFLGTKRSKPKNGASTALRGAQMRCDRAGQRRWRAGGPCSIVLSIPSHGSSAEFAGSYTPRLGLVVVIFRGYPIWWHPPHVMM